MKTLIKTLSVGIVLAAASAPSTFANDPMTESLRSMSGEQFDTSFLKQMIDHHRQGVEMAQLASRKGRSPAVKEFAEKTARMQQKDIEELTSLLGTTGSTQVSAHGQQAIHNDGHGSGNASTPTKGTPTTSHGAHGGTAHEQMKQTTMSKLQSAEGTDFDRTFAQEMLKHHESATEMAQLAQKKATREEVKAFAAKTVKMQEKEKQELKQLSNSAQS